MTMHVLLFFKKLYQWTAIHWDLGFEKTELSAPSKQTVRMEK